MKRLTSISRSEPAESHGENNVPTGKGCWQQGDLLRHQLRHLGPGCHWSDLRVPKSRGHT